MFDKVYVQSVSWLRSQVWVSWPITCLTICYKCLGANSILLGANSTWLGVNSTWLGANSTWLGANSIKFSRSGGELSGGELVMGRNRYKSSQQFTPFLRSWITTWQSIWQSKNLRFVLNCIFHLQVRLFVTEKVNKLEWKRESSTSDQLFLIFGQSSTRILVAFGD